MKEFKVTKELIKLEASSYTADDGNALHITDEQAEAILDNWHDSMPQRFEDFIRDEVMEGEILNPESDEEE